MPQTIRAPCASLITHPASRADRRLLGQGGDDGDAGGEFKGTSHIHVPRGADNEVRLVQYSSDGGNTWSLPIVVHGVYITITGLQSGTAYLFQTATSIPPQKGKQMVTAGSEALQWGDAISCMIM